MKNVVISLMFALMMTSCRSNKEWDEIFEKCEFNENTKICLILPEVGCGDCIAGGVLFLYNNVDKFKNDQEQNKVVFTAISSMKMLKRALNGINMDSLNCEIDTANNYLLPEPDGLYPAVLYLNKGKIERVDVQSPDNIDILKRIPL